jgi:DNA repair exonuclease SbcCD ATPase subunit
VANNYIKED